MLDTHPQWQQWTSACRSMVSAIDAVLKASPTTEQRSVEVGLGEGGDRTLVIDAAAEEAIFSELQVLNDSGLQFSALSEERGEQQFGSGDLRVVIDPIDGSLNAKRVSGPCALSLAVADGPFVSDVRFGFVYDFHSREEWLAAEGCGAWLNGVRLDPGAPARFRSDGRVEVLGIEAADPKWVAAAIDPLLESAYRLRALGAIAVSLCHVAAARFDAMASLRGCRSFDAAAAQLVVREAGGLVEFPTLANPLAAPLDLTPHSPVAAGRDTQSLAAARSVAIRQ
jgi:myo-inositol-1(or 4)-monophosphatase